MDTYNPTDSRYLTVSQTRTNNGQRDVKIILDVIDNLFYTLDDDGNFLPIGGGGSGIDLETILANGNATGANDLVISTGSKIDSESDVTLNVNGAYNLTFPLPSNTYVEKTMVFGGLNDFFTTDDSLVTIGTITPKQKVSNLRVRFWGYDDINTTGFYAEYNLAVRKDTSNYYQIIGIPNYYSFSDIGPINGVYVLANPTDITLQVSGAIGLTIGWLCQVTFDD